MSLNRAKLVEVAVWAAGEDAKSRLGLPSEWEQRTWFTNREGVATNGHCGTACCIAGKVALDEGWKPAGGARLRKGGYLGYADDVAEKALGLPDGHRLFLESNTLADVLQIINELLASDDH